MTVSAEKQALRVLLTERLSQLTDTQKGVESEAVCSRLERLLDSAGYGTVLATWPLGDEPDTRPFLEFCFARGTQVALARTRERGQMDFAVVNSLGGPWTQRGRLREPTKDAPEWIPDDALALCLVPGLGFNAHPSGRIGRLGRGGGYFDRWLSGRHNTVTTVAVSFLCQRCDQIPQEAHDQWLDQWLDAEGLRGRPFPFVGT